MSIAACGRVLFLLPPIPPFFLHGFRTCSSLFLPFRRLFALLLFHPRPLRTGERWLPRAIRPIRRFHGRNICAAPKDARR